MIEDFHEENLWLRHEFSRAKLVGMRPENNCLTYICGAYIRPVAVITSVEDGVPNQKLPNQKP